MSGFKQNGEITLPAQPLPLVAENVFIERTPEDNPLPTFDEVKHLLPKPLWENGEDYIRCYWKAWEIAFRNLRKPVAGTGFVSNFIDTAFNGNLFMWDSCFILMFGKYADRIFRFQGTLDNLYAHQQRDGFISREVHEETGLERFPRHDPSSTGPDIMAWCEWDYYLNFGDKARIAEVFPPLMAYHRWMRENRTWRDGTYFSSGWGCGMDNSPRLQPEYNDSFSHGHMVWVDACMQELNNCRILIKMAELLGRTEFVAELLEEQKHLEQVINLTLWDEETGFYYDLWKNGQFNMTRHVGAYWALLAECVPEERAERFIAYLEDPKEFKTEHRVPTLSKAHPKYQANGGYWCGSVWAPTNYMILKGLDKYGKYDLSHTIGKENLYAVTEVFKETGTLYENYAPEFVADGKPARGSSSKPEFVGWTGLIPISVMFEYVFGIKPDAAGNKITWHVNLLEKHGVEKYPFGTEGELTLICEARKNPQEKPQITLKSNVAVDVEIIWGTGNDRQSMLLKPRV